MRQKLPRLMATLLASLTMVLGMGALPAQAAQDCDTNAVIKCGFNSEAELRQKYAANQQGNVQTVFRYFGISSVGDLNGMVMGHVDDSNNVYIDKGSEHNLVATNALTAGRQNIPPSTPILNGQFYTRPPSVSFNSGTLDALIKTDSNGRFLFAVLMSCGNPVKATPVVQPKPQPVPVPNFTITKEVRPSGQSAWSKRISVAPGAHIEYRVTIHNTGQTDFASLTLRDTLPSGITFDKGSVTNSTANSSTTTVSTTSANTSDTTDVTINNTQVASSNAAQSSDGDVTQGVTLSTLAHGQTTAVVYQAVVSQEADACQAGLVNTVVVKVPNLPEKSDTATVVVCRPEQPAPVTPITPTAAPVQPTAVLPNTGPGTIIGATLGITTLAGFALHRLKEYFLARL